MSQSSRVGYCVDMSTDAAIDLGPRRPRGVTVIGVVTYVGGIADIVGGSMLLVLATAATAVANPVPGGLLTAITVIVSGILVVAIADGLMQGRRLARWIVTVVRSVSIIVQVVSLTSGGLALLVGIVSVLISAIVLSWLWTPRANAYFAPPARPESAGLT